MVEPFIEFLTANHVKLALALNDHVAPGVDLEIQKTRHAPASEQLATKWQLHAGTLWYRQQCQNSARSRTIRCLSRWDPPLSLSNALCHSHFPTLVTRRNLEMRCSQSIAHTPLVQCWLLQNDKWRLPAQPSTSFEVNGKLAWRQELLAPCKGTKKGTPYLWGFLKGGH